MTRRWAGVVPFGWRRPNDDEDGGLVLRLEPAEAELLREAVQRVLGGASTREVAHRWNSRGERTRNGAWWRDTSLRRALRRPYLAGWLPKDDDVARDENGCPVVLVEPLVTPATYERLQEGFAASATSPKRPSEPAMLSGLVRCAECGGPMHGRSADTASASYTCSRRSTQGEEVCPGNAVGVTHLDAYMLEWLRSYLSPDVVRDLRTARREALAQARIEAAGLRDALATLEEDRYEHGLYQGDSGSRSFRARHADLTKRLDDAEALLLELEASPLDLVLRRARDGKLPWAKLSDQEVHQLASSVIEAIEVSKGQRGKPFSPDRVNIVPGA